jgi:hypothetical protein
MEVKSILWFDIIVTNSLLKLNSFSNFHIFFLFQNFRQFVNFEKIKLEKKLKEVLEASKLLYLNAKSRMPKKANSIELKSYLNLVRVKKLGCLKDTHKMSQIIESNY